MIKRYERNDDDFPFIKNNFNSEVEKLDEKECEVLEPKQDVINTVKINKDCGKLKKICENNDIKKELESKKIEASNEQAVPLVIPDKIKKPDPQKVNNTAKNSLKSVFEVNKQIKEKKSKLKNAPKKNNRTKKVKPITFYFPPCRKSLVNSKKELILKLKKILKKNNDNELNEFIKKMHRNSIIFVLNFLKVTNKDTKAPKKILDNILFNILTSNIKIKFS